MKNNNNSTTTTSTNNSSILIKFININNSIPKIILLKILAYVHNGIYPSEQFLYCMVVCKYWRDIIPKSLKVLKFQNCSDSMMRDLMMCSILKQEYNESLEKVIVQQPQSSESLIRVLSLLTMPFFSKSSSILYQPPLKSLEISSVDLTDRGVEIISNILSVYNIKRLVLKGVQLNDNHLITISKALKMNHFNCLQYLDVSNNHFTKQGLEFLFLTLLESHRENKLDNLKNSNLFFNNQNNSLNSLSTLNHNHSNNNSSNDFSVSLPNNLNKESIIKRSYNLLSASLVNNHSQDNIDSQLELINKSENELVKNNIKLSHKPFLKLNLTSLDISNNSRIGLDCINLIKELLPELTELKSIGLSNISLCTEGLKILLEYLKKHKSICKINLSNNGIYPNGAEDIANILLKDNNTLESLDISENKLSLIGLRSILTALSINNNSPLTKSESSLKSLYLRRLKISFEESTLIRNMIFQTQNLKVLDFTSNQINRESLVIICEALSVNNTIQDLNLSFNIFGPQGCVELAKALQQNKSIRSLHLHCVGMKKEGAQVIAESLKNNNTLTELYLSNNEIKSSGCSHFIKLLKLNQSNIRLLDLSFNSIKNKSSIYQDLTKVLNLNNNIKIDLNGNSINQKLYKNKKDNCIIM